MFDYTYDGVMRSLEHSHLRLGLARIDIALIHDVDFWTTKDRSVLEERFKTVMDGGFKALDELRKAGVIGAIGVGINEADTSLRFIQAGDFDCMLLAGRYTLLEQGGLEAFLPECVKRNVSVILGGPYNSGILTGGVKAGATHDYVAAPAHLIEKAQKIEAVCQRHGVELGAAAMQFPLFHPAVCSVIPGALSAAEVKQNVGPPVGEDPGRALERTQARKAARSQRTNTQLSEEAATLVIYLRVREPKTKGIPKTSRDRLGGIRSPLSANSLMSTDTSGRRRGSTQVPAIPVEGLPFDLETTRVLECLAKSLERLHLLLVFEAFEVVAFAGGPHFDGH